MKIRHHYPWIGRLAYTPLLSFFFLVISHESSAQIYRINNLSGASEEPPNISAGTGSVTVTIIGTMMRIETIFSGLVGTTTATHIHAVTAFAGAGNTGVATTLPNFPGFPLGVTNGTYDMTFDMTQASSYNPAFISANGNTTFAAFDKLKSALDAGKAYFNIHTTSYPGGEIRGFFESGSYQILSSMLTFNNLAEAISNASPGDIIRQIDDAVEILPLEFPLGFIFDFQVPYSFSVHIP